MIKRRALGIALGLSATLGLSGQALAQEIYLSLIHISEPTRPY